MRFLTLFFCFLACFGFSQVRVPASSHAAIISLASNQHVSLILKVNQDFNPLDVQGLGAEIGSTIGNIVTLRVSQNKYNSLLSLTGIDYVQVAHRFAPNLKRVISDIKADSVYKSTRLTMGYTGKDVLIGITDWGFDYTHPMFYDTAMQYTRILAAWDQFKKSGPAPQDFNYGTEYMGEAALLAAEKDTVNIYGYATHGTHVSGIAGGGGAGTVHRGIAHDAQLLLATFLVDEAAVIDAFVWMQKKAVESKKRLVINMSWGLYNLGPLDGSSLVSQAIQELSDRGVVFVTSGGNNGDVNFHIKKTFDSDTFQSLVEFYSYGSNSAMWGQSIGMWGQKNETFQAGFTVYDVAKNKLAESVFFRTNGSYYIDSFLTLGTDTIFYNVAVDEKHPLNDKPTIRLRIKNTQTQLKIGLKACAKQGQVHFYNVTELTTDVGNWGMPFSAYLPEWIAGDNLYGLGEPASSPSVITVGAYQSEVTISNGTTGGGFMADFSSLGPTIDERMKPDIAAPGVNVASSISSFTDRSYSPLLQASHQGKNFPFARFSGTSMSSPVVAGVVALMLQANPDLSPEQIKLIIQNTGRRDKHTGEIDENGSIRWGYGKIDALEAVKMAEKLRNNSCCEPTFLYPNPTLTLIYSSNEKIQSADLYSYEGQFLGSYTFGGDIGVSITHLNPGLYFFHTKDGEMLKFLVQ